MDAERRPGIFSRRQFLARNAWIVGLAVAAACGPAASDSSTAPKPTTAPPGGQAAPAPTAASAAAAAKPAQASQASSGVFNVWFSANWNTVTDEAVGNTFVDWGKQNGLKVEGQSIPGSPEQLAKESAAVAAVQPPELNNANRTYWDAQAEMAGRQAL